MKDITFNDFKNQLTETDIEQIVSLIGKSCRIKTINRLRSMLTYGVNAIPSCGILNRLTKEKTGWFYCAGQSYPDEIRTVREIILKGSV